MLNGIKNEGILNSQTDKQNEVSKLTTNPIKNNPYSNADKSLLIDETAISTEAVKLYEREQDVKKFTNLALSDADDLSHEEIIANLFNKGCTDPFSDEVLGQLSINQNLLDDLAL